MDFYYFFDVTGWEQALERRYVMAPQAHQQLAKDYLVKDYLLNKEKFGIPQTTNTNQKKQINPTGLPGKASPHFNVQTHS